MEKQLFNKKSELENQLFQLVKKFALENNVSAEFSIRIEVATNMMNGEQIESSVTNYSIDTSIF